MLESKQEVTKVVSLEKRGRNYTMYCPLYIEDLYQPAYPGSVIFNGTIFTLNMVNILKFCTPKCLIK